MTCLFVISKWRVLVQKKKKSEVSDFYSWYFKGPLCAAVWFRSEYPSSFYMFMLSNIHVSFNIRARNHGTMSRSMFSAAAVAWWPNAAPSIFRSSHCRHTIVAKNALQERTFVPRSHRQPTEVLQWRHRHRPTTAKGNLQRSRSSW